MIQITIKFKPGGVRFARLKIGMGGLQIPSCKGGLTAKIRNYLLRRIAESSGQEMPDHLAAARRYRSRADDLRKLGAKIEEAEHRATLSKIADDYDRMANAEEQKSTHPPGGRRPDE